MTETIFAKSSIFNVWQWFEYISVIIPKLKQDSVPCYFHQNLTVDYTCSLQRHDGVVITTAQLHSTKSEHRFCAGSSLLAAYWRFRLGKIFEMVLAGNKAKCLSLVNHTTKTSWWWSSSDITIKNNIMSIIFLANNF